ncbi:MAG: hypothetical protein J5J00_06230 [Deltaproteobacteria bacterium]|nr:hypothetical protein [Deltaproteobacteria bacterium]
MADKGSFSFDELADSLGCHLPTKGQAAALAQIRKMAADYSHSSNALIQSSCEPIDRIRGLALEYKKVEQVSRGSSLRILTAPQARVQIFKANRNAKILDIRSGVVTFEEIKLSNIPRLPDDYAFKGGAARMALSAVLGIEIDKRRPRDLDIFRVGAKANSMDSQLAKRYMPEDFSNGHGIELVPTLRSYLHTRDLTINQVALINGRVVCTFAAIEDTLNRTLRPTDYIRKAGDDIQGKISMKMLRMIAEARLDGTRLKLAETRKNPHVTPFDVALHLERIMRRGTRAAQYYIEECIRHGYIEQQQGPIGNTIASIKKRLPPKKGHVSGKRGMKKR